MYFQQRILHTCEKKSHLSTCFTENTISYMSWNKINWKFAYCSDMNAILWWTSGVYKVRIDYSFPRRERERGYWKRGEDDCGDFNELADDFNEFVTAVQHCLDHRFVLKSSDDT